MDAGPPQATTTQPVREAEGGVGSMVTLSILISLTAIGVSALSAHWTKQAAAYRREAAQLRRERAR